MKMDAPTEDSVVKDIISGHCAYGSKDLSKHNCPHLRQRWYIGRSKSGRKTVNGVVYLDEWYRCTCLCHVPEDERPKPKTRRRRKR